MPAQPYRLLFIISLVIYFTTVVASVTTLYVKTYRFIHRAIKASTQEIYLESGVSSKISITSVDKSRSVERQVFYRCVMMSATLMICYLPEVLCLIIRSLCGTVSLEFIIFAHVFAATDAVFTPLITVASSAKIRESVTKFYMRRSD